MDDVIIIDDSPPVTSSDNLRFTCETCGEPLTYGGRGRHPRFCDEHKKGGTATGAATSPKRNGRQTAQITESMTQLYSGLGQGLVLVGSSIGDIALANDGSLIDDRAAVLAEQWAKLAETDPKVRKALLGLSTGSAWGGVIITHAMLAIAVMRNHQQNAKPKEPKAPKAPREPRQATRPQPTNGARPQPSPAPPQAVPDFEVPINVPERLYESG